MNDLKNELNSDEIDSNSSPQADVSQVVLQLTEVEGEEQAEVFSEILIDAEPGTIALLLES
ncbi:MAG: magnesium transporter, partial [Shewanella sp.]